VLSVVRDADGDEATTLAQLGRAGPQHPLVGVVFSLFLLAFAGSR
jgi:NADH-quinone oxidoreductase subunit N